MKHMHVQGMGPHDDRVSVRSEVIETVASWCEALSGSLSLDVALEELTKGLGAQTGMIVRTYLGDSRSVHVASCDQADGKKYVRPLKTSFADGCFGADFARARPATIWLASEYGDHAAADPALAEWQRARNLKEFVVLVLASGPRVLDHIELHFSEHLSRETKGALSAVLHTMARVWATRKVGLITRSIMNHSNGATAQSMNLKKLNVLGPENPARLSRAEFRVCLLLSNGLSVKAVTEELSIAETTVRTHLRNIYAKTDTNSLAELVFRLVRGRDVPEAALAKIA